MNILEHILRDVPDTWTNLSIDKYDNKYYIETLIQDTPEYNNVAQLFPEKCRINYIKRVQNPYQLGLFKIMKEKKNSEGKIINVVEGYHSLSEEDVEIALKYTMDYRRYKSIFRQIFSGDNKQPRFYSDISSALNCFVETQNKVIIICDILSESFTNIITSTQGDYISKYVISFSEE
ncbi:hypothetical protein PGB90_003725 [Kerria lacca]